MTTRTVDIDTITLDKGNHRSWADGACLLEAVAYLAGEPFSDHPECVCPVLAAFGRSWNDSLNAEDRNRILKPFIPKLIGTRSTPEVQDRRAFMAVDWVVRTYTPVWLRTIGLDGEATALEALPEMTSTELCRAAMPTIAAARKKAAAARAAAWAASRDAARDAARAAAWDAARDAARDAAWAAAMAAARAAARAASRDASRDASGAASRDAAWAAARDAAWAAARDAARAAAWAAARDAAWAAAWDAARDAAWAAAMAAAGDAAWAAAWAASRDAAGAASRDAAGARLAPLVEMLQVSAADLLNRMIEVTE